jgi:hypothetical protein
LTQQQQQHWRSGPVLRRPPRCAAAATAWLLLQLSGALW